MTPFNNIYYGKRVFITGHAGFKGSWLSLWLTKLGATVKGYSLYPWTGPSHWNLLNLDIESVNWDIGDAKKLQDEMAVFHPDIVFHLTAQAIVLKSYENPTETYETNVMGTLRLLEACRKSDSVRAVINVTSDKCYENKEWAYRYREIDAVGGYDPYSSSKACSEILSASYRNSYWPLDKYGDTHNVLLATCRASNVIGGGDWARDRLVPNTVRAVVEGKSVFIRDNRATRPWMHVLDALSGYLLLGQRLLEGNKQYAKPWNFGPSYENSISVVDAVKLMQEYWNSITIGLDSVEHPHEAISLNLDCSQALWELNWFPVWKIRKVMSKTVVWYKKYIESGTVISSTQIDEYMNDAKEEQLIWMEYGIGQARRGRAEKIDIINEGKIKVENIKTIR
jgi:CDP-glucose 4,6-dehydratase